MAYKVVACGGSHKGLVRRNNEDAWAVLTEERFFILADGMGGHRAGEVAAHETVSAICRAVEQKSGKRASTTPYMLEELRTAIESANAHVFRLGSKHSSLRGMGTTICCLLFLDQEVICAHVGDSRIYRWRKGILEQITRDDSLLMQLLDEGQLDVRDAATFVHKHIITKAIGIEASVSPSLQCNEMVAGDVYLMCTDGLSDLVAPAAMASILSSMASLEEGVDRLIGDAMALGGHDNITVILVKVESADDTRS